MNLLALMLMIATSKSAFYKESYNNNEHNLEVYLTKEFFLNLMDCKLTYVPFNALNGHFDNVEFFIRSKHTVSKMSRKH